MNSNTEVQSMLTQHDRIDLLLVVIRVMYEALSCKFKRRYSMTVAQDHKFRLTYRNEFQHCSCGFSFELSLSISTN